MIPIQNLFIFAVVLMFQHTVNGQVTFIDKQFDVNVTTDIVYDTDNTNTLTLDIYEPSGDGTPSLKPVMLLVHGGAWAAGDKLSSLFESSKGSGDFNTPMSEYANEFARRGYVCISINYRKAFDGYPLVGTGSLNALDFTGYEIFMNALLDTSLSNAQVVALYEMAVEDLGNAVQWITTNAATYQVDTSRIVLGGYSSGAYTALFAGNVAGVPADLIWANSGTLGGSGNEAIGITTNSPPQIIFQGDSDLIVPPADSLALKAALIADSVPHEHYYMLGENHYYLRGDTINEAPTPAPLEELLNDFMYTNLTLIQLAATDIRNNFSLLDTNGDGVLSIDDTSFNTYYELGPYDGDQNGSVSLSELLLLTTGAVGVTSTVYVDFSESGVEDGTSLTPFNTVSEAAAYVSDAGTISIETGSTTETMQIDKQVTLQATNGTVTLGSIGPLS